MAVLEKPTWNPQPQDYAGQNRANFYAGYSDGFHGAHRGAGMEPNYKSSAYDVGFVYGQRDFGKGQE